MRWKKRHDDDLFNDGQVLIVAVFSMGSYTYDIVTVRCDEGYFALEHSDGDSWNGEISDVDYYSDAREADADLRAFIESQAKEPSNA